MFYQTPRPGPKPGAKADDSEKEFRFIKIHGSQGESIIVDDFKQVFVKVATEQSEEALSEEEISKVSVLMRDPFGQVVEMPLGKHPAYAKTSNN